MRMEDHKRCIGKEDEELKLSYNLEGTIWRIPS